jgi:hypothetical protein
MYTVFISDSEIFFQQKVTISNKIVQLETHHLAYEIDFLFTIVSKHGLAVCLVIVAKKVFFVVIP